jgi:hypothetical protein
MIVTALQLFIFTYVVAYWVMFPCFTKKGTGYLRSVLASHVFFGPLLLLIFYGVLISV